MIRGRFEFDFFIAEIKNVYKNHLLSDMVVFFYHAVWGYRYAVYTQRL